MDRRWATVTAGLAAAASLLGAGFYLLVRRPLAKTKGTIRVPGLHQEVEIRRDRWGVPHIYASNEADLMFAQGFVHAQDRLWQMDFQRRLVAGRLSEVMGEVTLPVDRWLRILSMRWVAEQETALLRPQIRSQLEAYSAGVNARIGQGRLPVEFTLLRYKPEPWTPVDTLAWAKYMSWALSVNWEAELLRANLIAHLGPERAAELEPADSGHMPTIVPPGLVSEGQSLGQPALERAEAARPFAGPPAQAGLGSNSWALDGSRTATGAPLLANDMHLLVNAPSIWYENHLVSGDLNLTGVTFPGIPSVVAGHNGHVAWGFTNGFPDVQDLFLEHLRTVDQDSGSQRVQSEFQGEWHDAQVRREEIRIKGGETVVEEVIVTRHGPVINALTPDLVPNSAPDTPEDPPLALRWTTLDPDPSNIEALFAMIRARNCREFRDALRSWTGPVQNVTYADTLGNIGYSLAGRVPIRAKGDGRVPVPGWTGAYEWTGYIPFDELPHLYNPPQGYIATANNRPVKDDYPYELGNEFAAGDRALRILELLDDRFQVDIDYVKRMQLDQVSPTARVVADALGQLRVDEPELAAVVRRMRHWDRTLAADSPEAAIHQVFVRRMLALILEDKLGPLSIRYRGTGPLPLLVKQSAFGVKSWSWLQQLLTQAESPWFDLGAGEGRDDVMRLALRETIDFLKAELGPHLDDWAWGKLHTLTYAHPLGAVKPLDRVFNRGPFPVGGDGTTLWATGASRHDLSSEDIIGPPFRFIADLGDLRNSCGLLVPGQSGQLGSRHYDDQTEAWFQGAYHPLLYAREDVEQGTVDRLILLPDTGT
jgi:penicillin amidase